MRRTRKTLENTLDTRKKKMDIISAVPPFSSLLPLSSVYTPTLGFSHSYNLHIPFFLSSCFLSISSVYRCRHLIWSPLRFFSFFLSPSFFFFPPLFPQHFSRRSCRFLSLLFLPAFFFFSFFFVVSVPITCRTGMAPRPSTFLGTGISPSSPCPRRPKPPPPHV